MAKEYGQLANALDEMALHYQLDEHERLARDYQRAASELRTVEHIPPNPSELDNVSTRVRDSIAEWRAFGQIDKLQEFKEKREYMSSLTKIAKIGPKRARTIYQETGATDIEDIRNIANNGNLEDISGIGPKTATTIRRSIAQL